MSEPTRYFDQEAATWDQEPRRRQLVQDVAKAIAQAVPLAPDLAVMDFGCGTGLLGLWLLPRVARVVGVDSSMCMLKALQAKIDAQGLGNFSTYLLEPDLIEPESARPLPGPFDLIVSNMTLHHVPDVPALLRRLVGALRPGGHMALADLDPEQGQFHPRDDQGVFHNGFERPWLRREMELAGLGQVQERTAAIMNKPARDGGLRDFGIFLLSGRKPAPGGA